MPAAFEARAITFFIASADAPGIHGAPRFGHPAASSKRSRVTSQASGLQPAHSHLSRGTVHGFRVESETIRYLILTTPRHGELYRAITLPPGRTGRPQVSRLTQRD